MNPIVNVREGNKAHSSTRRRRKRRVSSKIPTKIKLYSPAESTEQLTESLKMNATAGAVISLFTLALLQLENEWFYYSKFKLTDLLNYIRIAISLLTVVQICLVFKYYQVHIQIEKLYQETSKNAGILTDSRTRKLILLEILLNLPVPIPYVTHSFKFYQLNTQAEFSLDDIIFAISLLRSYHILKFLYHYSPYHSARARLHCNLLCRGNSMSFVLKTYLIVYPFASFLLIFCCNILILGTILRVLERNIPEQELSHFTSGWWLISVTQSTLGYGDIYPRSHLGRAICLVSSILGMAIQSYSVSLFNQVTTLAPTELDFYSTILNSSLRETQLKPEACIYIQRWWRKTYKKKNRLVWITELANYLAQRKRFSVLRRIYSSDKSDHLNSQIRETRRNIEKTFNALDTHLDPLENITRNNLHSVAWGYEILQKARKLHNIDRVTSASLKCELGIHRDGMLMPNRVANARIRKKALHGHLSKLIKKNEYKKQIAEDDLDEPIPPARYGTFLDVPTLRSALHHHN